MKDRFVIEEQNAFSYVMEEQGAHVFKIEEQDPYIFELVQVNGDVIAPAFVSAVLLDPYHLRVRFNENLANIIPDIIDLVLEIDISEISISGIDMNLTLTDPVQYGQSLQIGYIPGTNKLQDIYGNLVEPFNEDVDITILTAPPVIIGVEIGNVNAHTWVLDFDKNIENIMPAVNAFAIAGFTFSSVSKTGASQIQLISNENAVFGVEYEIDYTQPAINQLQGENDNYVVTFSIDEVENNVAPLVPDIPTNLNASWINDFCRLSIDEILEDVQIEWYESEDGITYTLVTTTGLGITTYDNYTWQNATMRFRCRAKRGEYYSDYTGVQTLVTPLVLKTNQSTLGTVTFTTFSITTGKTVHIDWGDGTSNDYTGTGSRTKNYTIPQNPYYIQISGDVNWITNLNMNTQTKSYGDLSKWVIPTKIGSATGSGLYLYGCQFSGNPLSRATALAGFTGTSSKIYLYSNLFSGVPAITSIPATIIDFRIHSNSFSGDLSGISILRTATGSSYHYFQTNAFTDLPRGDHRRIGDFRASVNNITTAKLDAWFAYLNAFFATNTPVQNCTWDVSGAGNGIPTSGNSNTDILGIKAKFVAAGFIATITINT